MKSKQSGIIPRLYMKLLPVQILLVIIGGMNSIIDNAFAANLLGSGAMAVTGLFSPVSNFRNGVNALVLYIYAAIINRKPLCSLRDMMCFPKDFGVPDEDRIDISVRSMEEVINISRSVGDFCEAHGISARQKNCASLCVEELAGNIVRHGFGDGKKHCIDIRVSCVKGDVMLSLKDDCRAFNPTEAEKLFDPDDKAHNIGLRIASGMTKRMSYQNTFGLNILTMVI